MPLALRRCLPVILCAFLLSNATARSDESPFHPVTCEGTYKRHLQGFCTNQRDTIYWSWTDFLVKTGLDGKIQIKKAVADHHGDCCYHNGKVYVAVNLGKFNESPGKEDCWVYVYDAATLEEVSKHRVPELVHGAGGMGYHNGKFIVIGGLPPGINENYLYEYDEQFHFVKRHVLASGYTLMGIQTATWAQGSWWFGCYGKPKTELLRANENLQFTGKWAFNASVGCDPLPDGRFLIAVNKAGKDKTNTAGLVFARADQEKGLVITK